jgi:hypothetical protein
MLRTLKLYYLPNNIVRGYHYEGSTLTVMDYH